MADQSDVENALEDAIEAVRIAQSATWDVYRGWPQADALNTALAAGQVTVTVTPRKGLIRDSTRYESIEVQLPPVPPSLTVSVAGNVATFAGTCSTDQLAGVQVKNGSTTVHRCVAGDTPAAVASSLAPGCGGTASGVTLAVPNLVVARTGRDGMTLRPTRQIKEGFVVTVWCPDPVTRDAVAKAVDHALSDQTFLLLADGWQANLTFGGGDSTDRAENDNLYRRDLFYFVDYATTVAMTRPCVLFPNLAVNGSGPYAPQGATL